MKLQTSNIVLYIFIVCILVIFIIGFRYGKHKHKNEVNVTEVIEGGTTIADEDVKDTETTDKPIEDTDTTNSEENTETIVDTTEITTADTMTPAETNGVETTTIEETNIITDVTTNEQPKLISLGEFRLTAYCACEECCDEWAHIRPNGVVVGAIMEPLKSGYSIAVDPTVIPYRTEVVINGHTYKAQDCGGGIKGNRIDIYMDSHEEACDFGVQYAEVFMVIE